MTDDTICAISSPVGEGGIAVIRVSGPAAHSVLGAVFRPSKNVDAFSSRHLYLGFIFDAQSGTDVDEVFAVLMEQPHTYTREKMAEIYSHGGLAAQKRILALLLQNGARIAEPGEFTKRAYINGRIDLAQAESVLDIIESESDEELRYALIGAKGKLSEKVNRIKEEVKELTAEVEAYIDFPEEELEIPEETWLSRIDGVNKEAVDLISSYSEGRAIRDGLEVVIVGRTNVGKSSLLNALVAKERAIVTAIPGTTRDLVEDTLHIKGIKFRVTDTAGLRTPLDPVEKEGIERVRKKIPEADMLLWVLDGSASYSSEDEGVYEAIRDRKVIAVVNKTDLPMKLETGAIASKCLRSVAVSALNGDGLDSLKEGLYQAFYSTGHKGAGLLLTNLRHREALEKAKQAMEQAGSCLTGHEPIEFLAFELRDALSRLGEITGETCPEEILNEIFSRFCIGK